MSRRKKALEMILRQHCSTYNDVNNLKITHYWHPDMTPLKQRFVLWYENNNQGRKWN